MRILLVTPGFPPFPGGGERYAGSLALHLLRRECRVTVLTSTARTERDFWQPDNLARIFRDDQESGLHVLRCALHNMPGGRSGLLIWRKAMVLLSALPGDQSAVLLAMARYIPPISSLTQAFAQLPDAYDVIHAFNVSWEYPMVEAWQFARRHRRPLVITPFAHLGTGGHDRVARNSTMDHQMRILQEASAVLTLTNMERAGLIKRGVAGERVVMVGSGLDPLPMLMNEKDLLQQYHLTSPFIVFVGRASHDKGASHAAESIRLLRREGIAVTLVLIGQSTPEFERFYRNLDAADRQLIRPLGLLPDAQKHTLLQAASLLVLPSRTDSFGIVLLEAWAHGKPVIGARAGGIPGVIDDGQDGLLVDFGDVAGLARAIKRLLSDNTLRVTMGQRGQAKLSTDYSWKQVTDRVMNVYQQVI